MKIYRNLSKSSTVEYKAFHDAKQRCTNPNHKRYADWGGRGIKMLFKDYDEFIQHIGPRPIDRSLDRIDNNKHYEVGNVRWTTRSKQQHNKRGHSGSSTGIAGVRLVSSKGIISIIYQAYTTVNYKFKQLYTGEDFFEACCARKSMESKYD